MNFLNKYKPNTIDDIENNYELKAYFKTLIDCNINNILFIGNEETGKSTFIHIFKTHLIKQGYSVLEPSLLDEKNIQQYKVYFSDFAKLAEKKKAIVVDDIDHYSSSIQTIIQKYIDNNNIVLISSCLSLTKITKSLACRLLLISLKPFSKDYTQSILNRIKNEENLCLSDEFINRIVYSTNNSITASIKAIEKSRYIDDLNSAENLHNIISNNVYKDYIQLLRDGFVKEGYLLFKSQLDLGFSIIDLYVFFSNFIKNSLDRSNEYRKILNLVLLYIDNFYTTGVSTIDLYFFTNKVFCILHNNEGVEE